MGYTGAHDIAHLIAHPQGVRLLEAISAGSVFMGANSYIGNGPNFMVKAIAEQGGVKMPSFFGYMGYSVALLLPLFGLITFIFFR
jgi:Na+/H+ antiporter NhaD/arsenite permease-like protein